MENTTYREFKLMNWLKKQYFILISFLKTKFVTINHEDSKKNYILLLSPW